MDRRGAVALANRVQQGVSVSGTDGSLIRPAAKSRAPGVPLPRRRSDCQVIDVYVSKQRTIVAARMFFTSIVKAHGCPEDITTDFASPLLRVVDELFPTAFDDTGQDANNRIENDHGRLKERLRPMRWLRTDRSASNVIRGHAFVQTFGAVTANSVCTPVTNASSRGSLR